MGIGIEEGSTSMVGPTVFAGESTLHPLILSADTVARTRVAYVRKNGSPLRNVIGTRHERDCMISLDEPSQ